MDTTNIKKYNACMNKALSDIETAIANNNTEDIFNFKTDYSEKTIEELKNCMKHIIKTQEHIKCTEMLLSDMCGEEFYHDRLKERFYNE